MATLKFRLLKMMGNKKRKKKKKGVCTHSGDLCIDFAIPASVRREGETGRVGVKDRWMDKTNIWRRLLGGEREREKRRRDRRRTSKCCGLYLKPC